VAVLPLGGGAAGGVPFSGTYTVNSLGTAAITPEGGAARAGVAGPGARYLFAAGAADGGAALDLFLRTE
jgi:hypothetical protein